MQVKVKIINHSTHLLPAYATSDASGLDLRAYIPASITLQPMQRTLIGTGLHIALPTGSEAQIRPRSGLALKHGITVLNSPGTIDADYRGEVGVILINLGQASFTINRGERIAQMVMAPISRLAWREQASELAATAPGAGGFGSNGHESPIFAQSTDK